MSSSISRTFFAVGVAAGAVLIVIGFVDRGYAMDVEVPYEERVEGWQEQADGTVLIYGYADAVGAAAARYEIVPIDASTSAVYLVDDTLGLNQEVFRGSPASVEEEYGSGDGDFQFMIDRVDESIAVAYRMDEVHGLQVEVFRGTPEAVAAWERDRLMVVVFEGSRGEAEVWVDANTVPAQDVAIPNLTVTVGMIAVIAGLSMAWSPAPKRPAVFLIGGAVGFLPAAILHVLAASDVIDAGENTGYEIFTQIAFAGVFFGLVAGGVFGTLIGDRPRRRGIGRPTPA
jgi:hypothetical protein